MKSLSLIARLPHLTHEAFRQHYERVHVPLSLEHFRFARYARNFVTSGDPPGAEVDCVGEFTLADGAPAALGPEAAALFAADRALFMKPRGPGATASVEEELLTGSSRGELAEPAGHVVRKLLYFLRGDRLEPAAFLAAARGWGREWAARGGVRRVTLDRVLPGQPDFPAQAVVSGWLAGAGLTPPERPPELPAGIVSVMALHAEQCESRLPLPA